jgi:hypothetical protein
MGGLVSWAGLCLSLYESEGEKALDPSRMCLRHNSAGQEDRCVVLATMMLAGTAALLALPWQMSAAHRIGTNVDALGNAPLVCQ